MTQHMFIATLATAAFALSNTADAEICKYVDTDGNMHYTNAQPERSWKLLSCGLNAKPATKATPRKSEPQNAPTFTYPDFVTPTFEKEDELSAKNGFKKCEIVVTMAKR